MATIKTNQNNPDHKIFSYLSKLNPSSRYLLCSTHCKYPMGIRPIAISIWDIYFDAFAATYVKCHMHLVHLIPNDLFIDFPY